MTIKKNNVIVTLHNDPTESLYTGDIVTGVITVEIKKDLKVDSIRMEIIGICKAQWSRFSPTIPYLKIYSDEQKIFYEKQENLFYQEIKSDKYLRAGLYHYPFHFALPYNLPSTFNSSIASVSYQINIKSNPRRRVNKSKSFNVLANVNLNDFEDMLIPHTYEFQEKLCGKANVIVNFKTYKCFAPRQIIPFEVTLRNEKLIKIKKIDVTLIQKICYTVSSGYANDEINIHAVKFNGIKNTTTEVLTFSMEIPQIPPSSINLTEPMINISYKLKVEIFFSYHLNLIESIPVTVAAVPVIHNEFDNENKL